MARLNPDLFNEDGSPRFISLDRSRPQRPISITIDIPKNKTLSQKRFQKAYGIEGKPVEATWKSVCSVWIEQLGINPKSAAGKAVVKAFLAGLGAFLEKLKVKTVQAWVFAETRQSQPKLTKLSLGELIAKLPLTDQNEVRQKAKMIKEARAKARNQVKNLTLTDYIKSLPPERQRKIKAGSDAMARESKAAKKDQISAK